MSALAVKLTWNRCGRRGPSNPRSDGFEEIVTIPAAPDPLDDLCDAIYRIARRHLLSSTCCVHLSDGGEFWLEGGRYGGGRWEIVTTVSDGGPTWTA